MIDRRAFLGWSGALLVGVTACGDDDGGGTGTGTGGSGGSGGSSGGAGGASGGSGGTAGGGAQSSGGGGATGGTGGTGGAFAGCTAAVTALISQNHGHSLTIPLADIEAGVEMTYDATGSATHCHQVTLTAADFAALAAGEVVVKKSCNLIDHEYVLSCAPNPPGAQPPDCSADPNEGTCN
jgi:hypothetical protein